MDLAKESRRLARRAACTWAMLLILSSCAQRVPPRKTVSAVSRRPASVTTPAQRPTKAPTAVSAPIERRPTLQSLVPKRVPTKAEQIITMVREGYFVDEAKGVLVFSKNQPTSVLGSGLFEDAILLGRLRHALKETGGIPDSLSATATVRDAKAYLKIDDALPAPTAARAIDAALRTPGVKAVQARISG